MSEIAMVARPAVLKVTRLEIIQELISLDIPHYGSIHQSYCGGEGLKDAPVRVRSVLSPTRVDSVFRAFKKKPLWGGPFIQQLRGGRMFRCVDSLATLRDYVEEYKHLPCDKETWYIRCSDHVQYARHIEYSLGIFWRPGCGLRIDRLDALYDGDNVTSFVIR